MARHLNTVQPSIHDEVKAALQAKIPDAEIAVAGSGGHFTIEVVSPVFAGKSMLESQRLVLGAIKHLMAGGQAPVHAVDSIKTRVPT
jgi:acid stress-induced BolA-like protein IbaG/YrbA